MRRKRMKRKRILALGRNGVIRPAIPLAGINDRLLVRLCELLVETDYRDKDGKLVAGQISENHYGLFTTEQYLADGMDCVPVQGAF